MGAGIWAMHFVAMLAIHLNIPVQYDVHLVLLSILPAVISSGIALYIISRQKLEKLHVFLGAFFMALGIAFMHYIGMEAMIMDAEIVYNPYLFVLSILVAFFAAVAAIYLISFISKNYQKKKILWRKMISSLIMGAAISGMHYTGMTAASYEIHQHTNMAGLDPVNKTYLAYGIGIIVLILLGIVSLSIMIDRRFENQSVISQRRFYSVIESASDAIMLYDGHGTILSWNKGAEEIFGFEKNEMVGENVKKIIPKRYHKAQELTMEEFASTGDIEVMGQIVEMEAMNNDGIEFPIEISVAAWKEEDQIFFSSIIRDITERKRNENKMNQMVYLDPLTGLPNRFLLKDRLMLAINQAKRNHHALSILFIDLDRFKYINDTLGHAVGDKLLIQVAKLLQSLLGKHDTVSRQGGDEFIVLLPQTTDVKVTKRAKAIVDALNHPLIVDDQELYITPSIGIAMYPADGQDSETLIKNADTAMYQVKELGKNNFQFYTPEMNEAVTRKMKLEIGLRKALEREEFTVAYQPQINVISNEIIGSEALLRWNHPEWGLISPSEFIPIAEETGLILPIGEWILKEACLQNKEWQKQGFEDMRIAVNISSRQFKQSDLIDRVKKILKETGLAPHHLELELTESIIQDSKHAVEKMQQLKDMGIHLSIDDFGTGYSSLNYLKTFPIHTLKIDRSFTRNIFTDSKDASLVETIITMAHNLNLKVIAEGVETIEQLQFLQQKQCNEAQGYYFSHPISAELMSGVLGGRAEGA
ncbi:bifunctional diguanylate cyclase/phosphodiesterase [Jeotgalibacillus proteolyticus]|uniref:Bifunctional diguanylate cyclase/phosphodiesterase n=2 Tax=Jeotgalibacillus proteolyticus TaxID=2082395 RepID=A0A2S5G923_9BACL|nr:bifunctional diguanylate cyclase/phosphodiesterase [Jeotgalibacillus proteolyticus]